MATPQEVESIRVRLARLAWLLDSSIRVPGTQFRIGLDAILGLVPGIGDAAGVLLSGGIVLAAARLGAPRAVLAKMLFNVAVEGFVGAIPLAGDLFDAAWKANQRNVALLEEWLERPGRGPVTGRPLLPAVAAFLIALLVIAIALLAVMAWWIWRGLTAA